LMAGVSALQQAASMDELKKIFSDYLNQVHKQAIRLEEIFNSITFIPEEQPCDAMMGLIKEIKYIIDKTTMGTMTRDAALIIAAQKAGHYKIATYGSLYQLATSLGMEDVTNLLYQSLQEEKDNDLLLSDIADRKVNWLAETE
ncbi:MAG: DUF892 family protein, partial [Ferruginibacter sp.]